MPTTRERLEAKVADLRRLADEADRNPTPTNIARMKSVSDEVTSLSVLIRSGQTLTAAAGKATGLEQAFLADLPATGRRSFGAPALTFTAGDVAELHRAALDRHAKSVDVKTTSANLGGAVGDYRETPFPWLRDRVRILDLIPTEMTDAPSVWFTTATAAASAADSVAEGADKPLSAPTWARTEAPVRKLAHYAKVTDEALADLPNFTNFIGTEMLAGLIDAENEQLLNGAGVAPDLTGLLVASGIQTRAKGADTALDALFKATNDLRTGTAFTEADVIVLHPDDWGDVATAKNAGGDYLAGTPTAAGPATLWGVPVVVTTRIAAGTGMVANLKEAARVYVREAPRLEVNPLGGEAEFKANLTLIRAESRMALAVARPKAIVKVTGL